MSMTAGNPRTNLLFDISGLLQITGNTTITQQATDIVEFGTEYSIEINAGAFELEAGSSIIADKKGYYTAVVGECRVIGNRGVVSSDQNLPGKTTLGAVGPSHGGYGGNPANINGSSDVYGMMEDPHWSGASCYQDSAKTYGGGIIRLNMGTGPAEISGIISAHGDGCSTTGGYSSGSAGGSIKISAGAIFGSGSLDVHGGGTLPGKNCRTGAGGGRLAIYYDSLSQSFDLTNGNFIANTNASGGGGVSYGNGGAGTIYLKKNSDTYGSLLIDNKTTPINTGYQYGTPLKHPGNLTSASLTATQLLMPVGITESTIDTGVLGSGSYFLNPNINQNPTNTFKDDTLFQIIGHSNDMLTTAGNLTSVASASDTFAVELILKNLEIINGGTLSLPNGGRVRVLDGDISSNDTTTLALGDDALGYDRINTKLGSLDISSMTNGSITIGSGYFNTVLDNSTVDLNVVGGSPGIIYNFDNLKGMAISGGSSTFSSALSLNDDLTISTAGTVTFEKPITINGNVNVSNGTLIVGSDDLNTSLDVGTNDINLTSGASIKSLATEVVGGVEYTLYLKAQNISICATCNINANATGYQAPVTNNYFVGPGNVEIQAYTNGLNAAGSSYGGYAGQNITGTTHSPNRPYGNYVWPLGLGVTSNFSVFASKVNFFPLRIAAS